MQKQVSMLLGELELLNKKLKIAKLGLFQIQKHNRGLAKQIATATIEEIKKD